MISILVMTIGIFYSVERKSHGKKAKTQAAQTLFVYLLFPGFHGSAMQDARKGSAPGLRRMHILKNSVTHLTFYIVLADSLLKQGKEVLQNNVNN